MPNEMTEVVYVRMPKSLRRELERYAKENLTTMSTIARQAIIKGLADMDVDRTLTDARAEYSTEVE